MISKATTSHGSTPSWRQIQLRVKDDGQANVVRLQFGFIEEEHPFDDVHSALLFVRENLPCATTLDGEDLDPLETVHSEAVGSPEPGQQ